MARMKIDNYAIKDAPRLGFKGWLRWMWRQVTSMRIALILLLMLGVAAIPGSFLPQWPRERADTARFVRDNGWWGEALDRLGFLDVYGSAWFTAISVLLFVSLVGCIIPRTIAHAKALREPIAPVPSSLQRYAPLTEGDAEGSPEDAVGRVAKALRPQPRWWGALTGYRVRVDPRDDGLALVADKGHIREIGNLLFHASLVGLLFAAAAGVLLTFRGQAIVVEGKSFTNAVVAYDTFSAGRLFREESLSPFTMTLDRLDSTFSDTGRPEDFTAHVTVVEPGVGTRQEAVRVNSPLSVDGANIYLQGNGYAADLTFTDADGNVAFSGPVIFLPQDSAYTSTGVVKVPDVTSGEQVGVKATLYPSAIGEGTEWISIHPELVNPVIVFTAYTGDLGLDDGVPQNVYKLDESQLSPVRDENGDPATLVISPGETVELPGGEGTLTWNDTTRFAAFDLRADPSLPWMLTFALTALGGLALSLFGARRRLWLILTPGPATTMEPTTHVQIVKVQGAVLAPVQDTRASAELGRAVAAAGRGEEPA